MTGAPIPLDPFTDIIAVHWPETEMTKLDFVGNRYMVRNHDQDIADVVDHPEYRTTEGAILPKNLAALYEGWNWLRLINKEGFGEDHLLGAMNEAMRLDYTIIYEADWLDTAQQWHTFNDTGFFPPASWDTSDTLYEYVRRATGVPERGVSLTQGWKLVHDPGSPDQTVYATGDHDFWYINEVPGSPWVYCDEGDLGATPFQNPLDGGGFGPVFYVKSDPSGDVFSWNRDIFYQYENAPYLFRTGVGSPILTIIGTAAELPTVYAGQSWHVYEGWDPYDYYEVDSGVIPGDYVQVGSAYDWRAIFTGPPMSGGPGNPAPVETFGYIRFRTAVNFGPDYIDMCTNGGDVYRVTAPSKVLMPDPGNHEFVGGKYDGKKGHVYAVDDPLNYFRFGGGVKLRCVWILRKKQKTAKLRTMSVVKSLYDTDDPRWKKPKYI